MRWQIVSLCSLWVVCMGGTVWMKDTPRLCQHSPLFKSIWVINHRLSSQRPHTCVETKNMVFAVGFQDLCHFPTSLIHTPTKNVFCPPCDNKTTEGDYDVITHDNKCKWRLKVHISSYLLTSTEWHLNLNYFTTCTENFWVLNKTQSVASWGVFFFFWTL